MIRGLRQSSFECAQRVLRGLVRGRLRAGVATCVLATLSTSGCLVDEPPEFEEPERTAPIMFFDRAVPTIGQILVLQKNSPGVSFTLPVQSEDLGESLWVHVWINFGMEGETRIDFEETPPGTFDEPRDIHFNLETNRLPQGCVPITLVLQHEDNFDPGTLKPRDFSLATMATWYAVVDMDLADVSFADCPQASTNAPQP